MVQLTTSTCESVNVSQLDIWQALSLRPVEIHGCNVRATQEISPDNRQWKKAQAVFWCATRDIASLQREAFDTRSEICVAVNWAPPGCPTIMSQLASIMIGSTWVLNRTQAALSGPWLFCTINLHREMVTGAVGGWTTYDTSAQAHRFLQDFPDNWTTSAMNVREVHRVWSGSWYNSQFVPT